MKIIVLLFSALLLAACSDHYRTNSDGNIEFVDYRAFGLEKKAALIEDADPETFKALSEWYAKDKNFVFWQTQKVAGADPKSFKIINNYYGRDANGVFRHAKEIVNADPATFEFVVSNWTKDKANYYNSGKPVNPCDYDSFKILDEVGNLRALDSQCYYWDHEHVEVKDFSTFEILPGGYAKDSQTVYFMTWQIPDADVVSFTVKDKRFASLAKDKNACYSGRRIVGCHELNEKGQEFCECNVDNVTTDNH